MYIIITYQTVKIYCTLVNLDTSVCVKMAVVCSYFHQPKENRNHKQRTTCLANNCFNTNNLYGTHIRQSRPMLQPKFDRKMPK